MLCYLTRLVKRFFLYQFLFLFVYLKYQNISKSSYEFRDNVYELKNILGLRENLLDLVFSNPELPFKIFAGLGVVSALLATLGSKASSFISATLVGLYAIIYQNPIKAYQTHVTAKQPKPLYLPSVEIILLTGIFFAMLSDVFNAKSCGKGSCPATRQEVTEAGSGSQVNSGRDSKPSSGKVKKRI